MTTTKPAAKRPEIVLATWAGKTGAEHFGDRRFTPASSCDSMWLSLRVVDDDSYAAFQLRQPISDIGLWIWWSTDSDSIRVEFKAHSVNSATAIELEKIIRELRRLNKRVPDRRHLQGYADYVIATLKEAGLKRRVEYRGIGVKDEHHPLQSCFAELTREIEARSKKAMA